MSSFSRLFLSSVLALSVLCPALPTLASHLDGEDSDWRDQQQQQQRNTQQAIEQQRADFQRYQQDQQRRDDHQEPEAPGCRLLDHQEVRPCRTIQAEVLRWTEQHGEAIQG